MNAENILKKYKAGTCTSEELEVIEHYILFVGITPQDLTQMENELAELKSRIEEIGVKPKQQINWPVNIASVAAVILVLLFTVLFLQRKDVLTYPNPTTEVRAGKNKATLQLANGEVINLSDANSGIVINSNKISYNNGTEIAVSRNVSRYIAVLSTPRGGQYQIELPDGSKVWLNADSKISFSTQFSEKERKILLSGEAYFEVSKDKKRPFIVTTDHQTIEVLGTHFNINAYANDKSTTTTLLEGSVRVSPKEHHPGADRDGVVLKPNEQAINSGRSVEVTKVDPDDAIAWKNGEFVFNNEPLSSIMPRLARWYDVQVSYQNTEIGNKRLNGTISKFGKLPEILSMLEITGEVHFNIEGRRITLMP